MAVYYSAEEGTTMSEKKTLTLNLSEDEMKTLEELALRNDMTKTAVLKKAIRIYLILETRMQKGEHIFVEDADHQVKVELLLV
jgi:hypothetical protein